MFEKKYAIIFLFVIGFSFSNVYAETITGYDYFITDNGNGTKTFQTHYTYVFDGVNWTPFIHNNNQVETAFDTVILNSDGSYTWVEKGITDRIVAKYADISNLNSWTYPNTLNNDTPDNVWNGTAFISTKNKSGIGNLNYIYELNGIDWKTQLEATNLSSLTTKVFGFDEIFDIQSDTIRFGGVNRNLDNFHNQTFSKEFLDANQGKVLDLLNGARFDFDKGYENLHSITVYDTGMNSSRLVFDYRTSEPLLPGETLRIDPSINPSATNTSIESASGTGTSCGSWTIKYVYDLYILQPSSHSASGGCITPFFTFDTSAIPDSSIIDSVTFAYTGVDATNTLNCDIFAVGVDPTDAGSTAGVLGAIADSHINYVSNDSTCTTNGAKTELLGATANSDLKANLPNDYFAIGIQPVSMTRDGSQHYYQFTLDSLTVEYTLHDPPNAITDLTLDSVAYESATVSFTPPDLHGETLQSYSFYLQTPQTANVLTFFINSTDNPVELTGLNSNTPYSLNATAITLGGSNFTGMNILNFTTLPSPPSNLIGLSSIFTPLQVLLSWDNTEENVQGFKIERESPVSGGFVTLVNDTGNDTPFYEDNDVLENVQYNYRVSAWLDELTDPSNEFSVTISPLTEPNFTDLEFEPFNISWTNVTNPILLDYNDDGIIDSIYSWSYSSPNFILTKILGEGTSPITISTHLGTTAKVKVYDKEIWLGSSNIQNATVSKANIDTGIVTKLTSITLSSLSDGDFEFMKATSGNGATIIMAGHYLAAGHNYDMIIANSTTTLDSYNCNNGGDPGTQTLSGSLTFLAWERVTPVCGNSSGSYNNFHVSPAPTLDKTGGLNGWCNTTSCQVNNSGSIATISPGVTFTTVYKDYSIKTFANGFVLPSGNSLNVLFPKWTDYISNISTNSTKILNMHYKILDPTLTNPVPYALFYDTDLKLVQLGSTLKYADIPDINDRTFDLLLLDDYTGADYPTLASTSSLTTFTPYLSSITTTYATVNTLGAFSLPSGYKITPDATTTSRQFISDFTDSEELVPGFLGITSGLTELSILVKNAPEYFGLLIYDENELDNTRYLWSAQELQADNTITVDLPSGLCVYIVGTTFNTLTPETNEFGQLCASGSMPKTLFYSSNLSFTFWTLPYGVSHTFTQESSLLTTKVRHDTAPFEYTVEIYDADGTLQYDNIFESNSTSIDIQTINATGITLPALLKVFDDDNQQIYYSTIGTPGYFSGTVSWFAQYLTINGFNLLFLLPLVFGAMFTRNTVSVGTVITVVFIATLTWLGIIPLPDIAIYLLIFIGIIGMIAYKKIYD